MNFITISDFPTNLDQDYGCQKDDSYLSSDTDIAIMTKCGFCSSIIDKICHLYSNAGIDYYYLCPKCYDNDVRLCHSGLKFYFTDELVQLGQNVLVHYEQDELIELYQKAKNKNQVLDIYGINPDGLDYNIVDITNCQEM